LLTSILAKFHHDLAAITAWARHAEAGDYAQYAPQVIAAGHAGDSEATAILKAAGASLGDMLLALKGFGAPRLSLIGGLAEPIKPWLPDNCRDLVSPALGDPIDGAILMARRRHLRGEVSQW
jgi:glucosamine kinase